MNNENIEETEDRSQSRSDFSFPVKITIYSQDFGSKSLFDGFIHNMSANGACIQFEDRYGRIEIDNMKGARIKLAIKIPRGDDVLLNASIHWARKEKPSHSFLILMGVELREIEDWQVKQIDQLINLRNKDHKMLWTLLDQYLE